MTRLLLLFAVTLGAGAQSFEVASVKLSGPKSERGSSGGPGTSEPGRYYFHGAELDDLIATAYHVDYFQIASKVPLDEKRFDVDVKVAAGTTKEQFRAMMRTLLQERFHLRAHVEQREYPAYELAVAKGGFKLNEGVPGGRVPGPGDEFPELSPDRPGMSSRHTSSGGYFVVRMRARQQSLASVADWIRPPDGRPVVDRTGIGGKFDFAFEYAYPQRTGPGEAAEPSMLPDLFAALQQQLGLQLISKRVPFDTVVVESVDKVPTEN